MHLCCQIEMAEVGFPVEHIPGANPHFICSVCGGHVHGGDYYTQEEWFRLINEAHFIETTN